jgi:hypothetical protein
VEEILPRVTLTADIKDLHNGFFTQRASDDMEAVFRKLMLDQPPLGQFAELQPPKGRPPLAGPCAHCGAEESLQWNSGPGTHPALPHTLAPPLAIPLKLTSMSHLPACAKRCWTLSGDGELDTDGTLAAGQFICMRCYDWHRRYNGELPSEEVIKRLMAGERAAPKLAGPCANPNCGAEETSDWRSGPGAHPILPHTLTCSVSHYPLEAHLYVAPSSVAKRCSDAEWSR